MNTAAFANAGWLASSLPAWNRFRRALGKPKSSQREILRRFITSDADCAFGRAHGFSAIHSYEEFRERVPTAEFQSVEPWVARIMHGENNVLTCEAVTRLLPTSGSTGGRKFIPFTAGFQREGPAGARASAWRNLFRRCHHRRWAVALPAWGPC